MSKKEQLFRAYQENQRAAFVVLQKKDVGISDENDIWRVLQLLLPEGTVYTEVIFQELSVDDIVNKVSSFLHANGRLLGKIQLDIDKSDLDWLQLDEDRLEKAKIKIDNIQWYIHQNDEDPFPSKPHGHDYGSNLKVNLKTGELFRKKELIGSMPPKKFYQLQEALKSKYPKVHRQLEED